MSCSCKKSGQVTKVKQVIKKPIIKNNASNSSTNKPIIKRIIYKRPI